VIVPVGSRVLIRPYKGKVQKGSIIIPERFRQNQFIALVLAIGPDVVSPSLKVGETVLYNNYVGLIVDKEKNEMLIKEDGIVGIVEGAGDVSIGT